MDAQAEVDNEESNAFWLGACLGVFPVSVLLMAVFLPTVHAEATEQWQVDTIWELALGIFASIIIGGVFGFCASWFTFAIAPVVTYFPNRKRDAKHHIDFETVTVASFGACGMGLILALIAVIIKSYIVFS